MPTTEFDVTGEREDGTKDLELDPPLQLVEKRDLTLRDFVMGCHLIDIDPDRVLAGKSVELPHRPPLENARGIMGLVVENAGEYDIGRMPAYQVDALLGVVVNHFISASRGR